MTLKVSHDWHIPVMGIVYTLDTATKVARFGINSVMSIVHDQVIEMMYKHHSEIFDIEYEPIDIGEEDYRARRITRYLNLVDDIVEGQMAALRTMPLDGGFNDLHLAFQLLSPTHPVRGLYESFMKTKSPDLESMLKDSLTKGRIDVNIMTKLDRPFARDDSQDLNEAMAALRGFANSKLESSLVLSAGMNPPLFTYIREFPDFLPDDSGKMKKKVILKISDYKSMRVQSKLLASKGVWVSEYRIESGLNCGGHAFGSPSGQLAGPIVEEIMANREKIHAEQLDAYRSALSMPLLELPPPLITYQGGIKTHHEKKWFLDRGIEMVGMATPFLFVPSVTILSENTREVLIKAKTEDIELSDDSPLGIDFWRVKNTLGDIMHNRKIAEGDPGYKCTYGYLRLGEDGLCSADRRKVSERLEGLKGLPEGEMKDYLRAKILAPHCLCGGLIWDAKRAYGLQGDPFAKTTDALVCAGPSAAYFKRNYTLLEMVRHFNGEAPFPELASAPNTHIEELRINVEKLEKDLSTHQFRENAEAVKKSSGKILIGLLSSIDFYKKNIGTFRQEEQAGISEQLGQHEHRLAGINAAYFGK